MLINNHPIGREHPPFIVAELGAGHNRTTASLLHMLESARHAGADAVKIQVYRPEDLTLENLPPIADGAWAGRNLWNLYARNALSDETVAELFAEAKRLEIPLFASVFSPRAIPFLESLGCPAYKIASLEINHRELQFACKETGKPIIMSTGCASIDEVYGAYWAMDGSDVAILHCVSGYPTLLADVNLPMIQDLQRRYDEDLIGFSDHTKGETAGIMAVAYGATIIEKHMACAGSDDADFGLRAYEFEEYVRQLRGAWYAGRPRARGTAACEAPVSTLKRAIVALVDMEEGALITAGDFAILRTTMSGLDAASPALLPMFLGERLSRAVKRGQALCVSDVNALEGHDDASILL